MRKELFKQIEIPQEVNVEITGNVITVKGPEGENRRKFDTNKLTFEKKGNQIVIGNKKATKTQKMMMNTISAHIENMFKGVKKKFVYTLKVCFSHFPISVVVDGRNIQVKNFLGEKVPRKMKIPEKVEIKVDKEIITLTSYDKEIVGQAAANIEMLTKISKRDRRIFQDGIYIINKDGKES